MTSTSWGFAQLIIENECCIDFNFKNQRQNIQNILFQLDNLFKILATMRYGKRYGMHCHGFYIDYIGFAILTEDVI